MASNYDLDFARDAAFLGWMLRLPMTPLARDKEDTSDKDKDRYIKYLQLKCRENSLNVLSYDDFLE